VSDDTPIPRILCSNTVPFLIMDFTFQRDAVGNASILIFEALESAYVHSSTPKAHPYQPVISLTGLYVVSRVRNHVFSATDQDVSEWYYVLKSRS
jgi:hypothetical protein